MSKQPDPPQEQTQQRFRLTLPEDRRPHRYWERPRPPEPKDTKEGRVPNPWWRRLLNALPDPMAPLPPPLPPPLPVAYGYALAGRFPITHNRPVLEADVSRVLDRFEDYRAQYGMSLAADPEAKPKLRALVRAILEEVS